MSSYQISLKCLSRLLVSIPFFCIFYSPIYAVTLSGRVVDKQMGSPIENAQIQLINTHNGTISNDNGEFRIEFSMNDAESLLVTHIAYQPLVLPLESLQAMHKHIIIELEPAVLEMPEVNVSANRYERERRLFLTEPSPHFLSASTIIEIPTVATPDFHRALQSLPGIVSNNEASTQLSVRGGNIDQNLILLDGAAVYHPYNMGLISSFNMDIIDAVNISTGGFSAQYGNRLSSVISIHTVQPKRDFQNRASISLINADMTLGGKIGSKMGWLVSGRRNYYDLIAKMIGEELPLSFQDYYGKLTFQPNASHFISLSAYQNWDDNNLTDTDKQRLHSTTDDQIETCKVITNDHFNIRNQVLSFMWEFDYSKTLSTELHLTSSSYRNSFDKRRFVQYPDELPAKYSKAKARLEEDVREYNEGSIADIKNSFGDYSGELSVNWTMSPMVQIKSGIQITHYNFDYGWKGSYDFGRPYVNYFFDYSPEDYFDYDNITYTGAIYAECLWDVTPRLHVRPGIRFSRWKHSTRLFAEPRFSLKYDLNEQTSFKFACGEFTQGIATCLENDLLQVLELYFPVQQDWYVEQASHVIVNLEYNPSGSFGCQVTGYYKPYSHLLKSVLENDIQQFTHVNGEAFGVEFEAHAVLWGFKNRISYVLSHSYRSYRGVTYDTNFDRRHRAYVSLSRQWRKWSLSSIWELYSGQPYNPGRYRALYRSLDYDSYRKQFDKGCGTYDVDVPPGRIRYPWYHRLDVSISRRIERRHITCIPYLSIRNVYNRKNVLYYRDLTYRVTYYGKNHDQ